MFAECANYMWRRKKIGKYRKADGKQIADLASFSLPRCHGLIPVCIYPHKYRVSGFQGYLRLDALPYIRTLPFNSFLSPWLFSKEQVGTPQDVFGQWPLRSNTIRKSSLGTEMCCMYKILPRYASHTRNCKILESYFNIIVRTHIDSCFIMKGSWPFFFGRHVIRITGLGNSILL